MISGTGVRKWKFALQISAHHMNIACLALDNIKRFGEYNGYIYEGRCYTNVEHQRYSACLARVLHEHGVRRGDRVLAMMPNSPETIAAFQATWMLGATIVPVTPQLTAREARYILEHSESKVCLGFPTHARVLRDAGAGAPDVHLLLFGPSEVFGAEDLAGQIETAAALDDIVDCASDEIAMLLYTSGTTGRPKGVMLTHENLVASVAVCFARMPVVDQGRFLLVLPLSHVYGVIMLNLACVWGFSSVILPRFDPTGVLRAVVDYKVQRIAVVPAMLIYLMNHPERDRYDTSSLFKVLSGGAALPEHVRTQFEEAFRCRVDQGYGLSETAAVAVGYPDAGPYRAGSAGTAHPGLDVRILDENKRMLPPGVSGEICIRGPVVMRGYWKDPEATEQAFVDGWFLTGDIGYLDQDGYLFITDRKKDLIIKGGENISPREIEEAIHQHPAVSEVAVVGIADETFGENVCAVVVPKAGRETTEEEIKAHAGRFVTKFKIPAKVVFRDALPKNAANKILKRVLREELSRPLMMSAS